MAQNFNWLQLGDVDGDYIIFDFLSNPSKALTFELNPLTFNSIVYTIQVHGTEFWLASWATRRCGWGLHHIWLSRWVPVFLIWSFNLKTNQENCIFLSSKPQISVQNELFSTVVLYCFIVSRAESQNHVYVRNKWYWEFVTWSWEMSNMSKIFNFEF